MSVVDLVLGAWTLRVVGSELWLWVFVKSY